MKKHISLLLCLCMMLPLAASCSESTVSESEQNSTPSASESVSAENAVTEETRFTADIPAGTNLGGMTYTVAAYPAGTGIWGDVDWSAEEYTGEVLNDAVFTRIAKTEDALNVDIVTAYTTGSSDTSTLANSVTANDGAYQLYNVNMGSVIPTATKGYLQEVNRFAQNGTLDLDAAWWDQNCLADMSIANANFCLTGDIGTMYKKSIGVIMFNKTILEQNQLPVPYDYMYEGTWTIDKMVDMGTKISKDLDGNGTMDRNDQYGLICFRTMMPIAMIGCDVPYFTKDENDLPQNTFFTERSVSVIEKLATLMYDPNLTYSWSIAGGGEEPAFEMFQTDKSLFYYGELHAVATMRNMESPFGIMPMPKFDEAQEGFHHCVNFAVAAVYVIPKTNIDYESSGYIMDCLGAESKNELTPAYYDITLQGKVSRDEESSASLDIIINSIRYDLGYLGGWGINNTLEDMADSYDTELASKMKSSNKVVSKSLEKALKQLTEMLEEYDN